MLTNFIREAADHTQQSAVTVPEPANENGDVVVRIKRKDTSNQGHTVDIYDLARVIYYRARRQGLARAANIF